MTDCAQNSMGELFEERINALWDERNAINAQDRRAGVVSDVLNQIDTGTLRVCEKKGEDWIVHQWVKKAVLLSFRLQQNKKNYMGFPEAYDKVPLKFESWGEREFEETQIRAVPGSIVRHGAYIAPKVILMPSFVNIGAYVGEGTLVDTWASVGSCAQIGKNCHLSGGAGIGGVLEPLQANPVIIEDNCFIGARSEIVEGVHVGEGAVIGMGVYVGASTPIYNRETGEVCYGKIPPYSVVISGTRPDVASAKTNNPISLYCAVIVKTVDEKTRSKTALNELLRP